MGKLLDVTFQQIQKYENGANRISAGRLHRIAEILAVPITYFYSGFEDNKKSSAYDRRHKVDFNSLAKLGCGPHAEGLFAHPHRSVRLQLLKLAETLDGD